MVVLVTTTSLLQHAVMVNHYVAHFSIAPQQQFQPRTSTCRGVFWFCGDLFASPPFFQQRAVRLNYLCASLRHGASRTSTHSVTSVVAVRFCRIHRGCGRRIRAINSWLDRLVWHHLLGDSMQSQTATDSVDDKTVIPVIVHVSTTRI